MLINWWDLLLISFAVVACIQLFYYLWFFRRLAFYHPEDKDLTRENAVSIIVCARDEAENLANNLPGVLVQTYRSTHEVVLVNDNSQDETRYLLEGLHKQFRQLNIVELKQEAKLIPGKKFPLSVGVKSAVTAYVPAFIGTVELPLYSMFVGVPATDPLIVAFFKFPSYVRGEFVIMSVGFNFEIVNPTELLPTS